MSGSMQLRAAIIIALSLGLAVHTSDWLGAQLPMRYGIVVILIPGAAFGVVAVWGAASMRAAQVSGALTNYRGWFRALGRIAVKRIGLVGGVLLLAVLVDVLLAQDPATRSSGLLVLAWLITAIWFALPRAQKTDRDR